MLWDGGSTLSFITYSLAKSFGLKGKPTRLAVVVVGGHVTWVESQRYQVRLVDGTNEETNIEVFGIEKISSSINRINLEEVAQMFNIPANEISRPQSGEVDILIGMQYAAFHPVRYAANGHLLLMKNQYGMVIAGSHPSVKIGTQLDQSFVQVKHAVALHAIGGIEQFYEIEGLGVTCQPKCGSCKCGQCHPGGKDMSIQEEKEYESMKSNIIFNPARGRWLAKYPWIRDPKELQDNRRVAFAVLKATERKLKANREYADMYSKQMKDMLDRKAARKVTEEELRRYPGPKFYLAHHGVLKLESKSTLSRVVFNSSARFYGLSPNDCLAKGPSLLIQLPGVLLRWRRGISAFIGDISKMYHSIDIPLRDQMTHLYLLRDCNENKSPETLAITVVNMGDKPSAVIAQIAMRKTVEESIEVHPIASQTIIKDSYMDDILSSTDSDDESVAQMKAIDSILGAKGFKIKEWISNICSAKNIKELHTVLQIGAHREDNTEGVLGMKWDVENDAVKFKVNLIKSSSQKVTKRSILSIVNGFFDPLGLLTPFTVKCKIIMRKIFAHQPKLDWDEAVPREIEIEWQKIVKEIPRLAELSFKRSLTPKGAIGLPKLIILDDGSKSAFGAVAYARWRTRDGYVSCLIAAKSQMTPIKVVDTVRSELCGAVISKRLRCMFLKELNALKFEEVIQIVDSEIVHAMIHRGSYGFNTFVANRIGEIQQGSSPDEWFWLPGKLNVADLTTRGASPEDLNAESAWQQGPKFMQLQENDWPIRREVKKGIVLPELTKEASSFVGAVQQEQETLASRINASRFSKWKVLQHVTARILKLYDRFKHGGEIETELSLEDLERAKNFWIKDAQRVLKLKELKKLNPMLKNEVMVAGGRGEHWM